MSPGSIGGTGTDGGGGPSGSVDTSTGAEGAGQSSVSDPGPGDESFAFGEDFERVGDEPLESNEAPAPGTQTDGGEAARAAQPAAPAQREGTQPTTKTPPAAQPAKPAAQEAKSASGTVPQPQQSARQPGAEERPTGPLGPRQIAERLAANRDTIINDLAGNRFKVALTEGETKALEEDAIKALPSILSRLGAQLYYEMAMTSLNQIQNFVPQLAQQTVQSTSQFDRAENNFFAKWSNIDRNNADHVRATAFFSDSFRKQNPSATEQQAIDEVGRMVSAYLGLPAPQAQRSATPARPNGAPRPFAPAGGGGVAPAAPRTTAASDWSGMGQDFDG
jgi:hypothetical protein